LSKIIKSHQPCPKCTSSDAYCLYDDGHGYCFSCTYTYFPLDKKEEQEKLSDNYKDFVPTRGISVNTMRFFNAASEFIDGKPANILFEFEPGYYQVRSLNAKAFRTIKPEGEEWKPMLFGKNKFSAASNKSITITEGAFDALAVYEMNGNYPVVAVQSATSALKECSANQSYLNSFDEVILCLDNDEQGEKAARQIASLFDFNKVKKVNLSLYKDANDYLINGKTKEFRNAWFNAKRYMRDDIISSYDDIEKALLEKVNKPSIAFPFAKLQDATWGARYGDVVLLTAQEGIGKTEIVRAIEYDWLKKTDVNIGVIHLEESKDRTIEGLVGYELHTPVHFPNSNVSIDEKLKAYKNVVKRNDRLHIFTHFGSDDPNDLLSAIRFLVASCGCRAVFLDHITMVVTGRDDGDERKDLDYLSTQLKMLAKELDFILVMVSHVNDDGKTRGSRNISKIADIRIDLTRDILSNDPDIRNTTHLSLSKNRFGSVTGPAGALQFDFNTFMIEEKIVEMPPVEDKEHKSGL
jgi:twinkle protein